MLKWIKRIVGLLLLWFMMVCTGNQALATTALAEGVTLRNSRLYVYSFLDVREDELGPLLLAKFDELLVNELAKANVAVKVLRFRSSEVGRDFVIAKGHSMRIPIAETINLNLHDEREMGAAFRLIVIPTHTVSGRFTVYQTEWVLIQIDTGNKIWSRSMTLRKSNGWNNDDAHESAHKLVNDTIIELQKSGLL